jgi:hypothetical protein
MVTLNSYIVAAYTPLRLTVEEMKDPRSVIDEYFNTTDLDATRDVLWEAFSQAVARPDEELGSYARRELLFHYAQIVRLIEAICLVCPPPTWPSLKVAYS